MTDTSKRLLRLGMGAALLAVLVGLTGKVAFGDKSGGAADVFWLGQMGLLGAFVVLILAAVVAALRSRA